MDVYDNNYDYDYGVAETKPTTKTTEKKKWWEYGYYYGGYSIPASDSPVRYGVGGFGRSTGDPYGYKSRYKSSLGWESGKLSDLNKGSIFTYYGGSRSSHSSDDERILTNAYKSVRDMIVILNFPFKVDVKITNSGGTMYYFDDRSASAGIKREKARILIPTKILDDSSYKEDDKITIFCGLGIHEAAHLKYTRIRIFKDLYSTIKTTLGKDFSESRYYFLKTIIDMLEDERVEDSLLKERPGYSDFIEKSKGYSYKEFINDTKTHDFKTEKYLNNLFRLIRYPENIEESALEEFSDSYQRIRDIVLPLPTSTKEACDKGIQVFNEILSYFKEIKLPECSIDEQLSNATPKSEKVDCTHSYGFDCDLGFVLSESKMSISVRNNGDLYEKIFSGAVERGAEKSNTYFYREPGNREAYNLIAKDVSKYVPGIRNLIRGVDKNYDFCIYGCRNGLLDTNKLAEAYQGVPQVYVRKGQVKTNRTTVCVLIDESGSMSCRNKDIIAKKAAILLNEALGNLPGVDLYIYGHTADLDEFGGAKTTNIKIYREGSNRGDAYSLSESKARFENRDGTAILETARRIRKFTDSPCLMFVLSDGDPCAYDYWGRSAEKDVYYKVKQVEGMNFTVVQVCIDTVTSAHDMFDNVINLKNKLENLPKELSKVIKKAIVNNKRTEIFS